MQAKDLDDRVILAFLSGRESWAFMWDMEKLFPGAPAKVVLAKMRGLVKRKLVDGCTCGCRGDFEITGKGRTALGTQEESDAG